MNKSLYELARVTWASTLVLANVFGAEARLPDVLYMLVPSDCATVLENEVAMKDVLSSPEQGLAPGNWGGEHISLEITQSGGNVEFDCAHGTLTQKIALDKLGRFDVAGTYEAEHGGPVRDDQAVHSLAVRYVGEIKAGRMTLKIRRRDTRKLIGTFTLKQGEEAFLVKCR